MNRVFSVCLLCAAGVAAQPPSIMPMSPASGQGSEANLVLTVSEPKGVPELAELRLLVKNEVDGEMACYVTHNPASGEISLRTDDDSAWGLPMTIGSDARDMNSQCTVSAAASSVVMTEKDYTLNLHVHFNAHLAGVRRIWAQAMSRSGLGASRWREIGQWVVPQDVQLPRRLDRFRSSECVENAIVLSTTPEPSAVVRIFQNGLLLAPGDDYTVDNRRITFVRKCSADDVIQVDYSPRCSVR